MCNTTKESVFLVTENNYRWYCRDGAAMEPRWSQTSDTRAGVSVSRNFTTNSSAKRFILYYVVAFLFTLVIVTGDDSFKDGIVVSRSSFYLQKEKTQRIFCESLAVTTNAILISWVRVTQTPDGNSTDLIVRWVDPLHGGKNYSVSGRYQLARDYSLVIESVVEGDTGLYQCQKVSSLAAENAESTVKVLVLDKQFPVARGRVKDGTNRTVQRGEEVNIQCPIKEASNLVKPTFYWSREVTGPGGPTDILAQVYSDGEITHSDDYRIAASNDILLSTQTSGKEEGLWCHMSSTRSEFYLQSARVYVEIQEKPSYVLVAVLVSIIVILLFILIVGVLKRNWIRKQFFSRKEIIVLGRRDGPTINTGGQDKWVHELNLGRKGKLGKTGDEFSSLKSVAVFNDTCLAVLDDTGLYTFSPDFIPMIHVTKLLETPQNYVTMVAHDDKYRLLLGAKNGEITCVSFKPNEETMFCSLSDREGISIIEDVNIPAPKQGFSDKVKDVLPFKNNSDMITSEPSEGVPLINEEHALTAISVDRNGKIYAGDESNNSITVFLSEGRFFTSLKLGELVPKILAARSAGEIFVHSGNRVSPIIRVDMTGTGVSQAEYIKRSDVLNPVNILVDNSSLYVVSDTKCNGQMEIFQYDRKGNFLRQLATPWRGMKGLCLMESSNRLALYDNSIVRIYKKEEVQTV